MKKINLISIASMMVFTIFGFLAGIIVAKSSNSNEISKEEKWLPKIIEFGEWAAALAISDEIQVVVATSPDKPKSPVSSVGYRHNRTMLLQHLDKDRNGEFEQLQFNDPVTGQIHLYFLDEAGIYRNATNKELDERLKEIESAPGD